MPIRLIHVPTQELLDKPEFYFSFSFFDISIVVVSRRKGAYYDVNCKGFIPSLVPDSTFHRLSSSFVVRCPSFDSAIDCYQKNVCEVLGEL